MSLGVEKGDNFHGRISVARCSRGYINIRVRDKASKIEFLDVRMSKEDFADCITGLAELEVKGAVRGLKNIGKTRIQESRQALFPGKSYDKLMLSRWLMDEKQEEGWIISTYLGSQSSITQTKDGTLVKYSATKYVTKE